MRSDHHDEFMQLMLAEGVSRRHYADTVREPATSERALRLDPNKSIRRQLAAGAPEGLSLAPLEWLHPADPIGWKRDGVQEGVFRNLRLGRYSTDACLNLQHCTLAQARDEVAGFVRQSAELNIRCVLIQQGRARRSDEHANQLKTYLNQWLPELEQVMAFHSAPSHHGGTGAVYLMLRKSEQARQENREKHQKRR
jgi:DNA-nicking Smr family endonuclease